MAIRSIKKSFTGSRVPGARWVETNGFEEEPDFICIYGATTMEPGSAAQLVMTIDARNNSIPSLPPEEGGPEPEIPSVVLRTVSLPTLDDKGDVRTEKDSSIIIGRSSASSASILPRDRIVRTKSV